MTEFSRELLTEKLARCAEALADLKRYQDVGTLDYLREHQDIYYAVCYRFISVIEALFDAGQIILASHGLHATSDADIPVLLGRKKIIADDLTNRFTNMYGFRNRLVHAYGTLDDAKVAEYLQQHLIDIEDLLKIFRGAATSLPSATDTP